MQSISCFPLCCFNCQLFYCMPKPGKIGSQKLFMCIYNIIMLCSGHFDLVWVDVANNYHLCVTANASHASLPDDIIGQCHHREVNQSTHRNMKVPSGTENGSSEWCQRRTISGSTKNLSNQGSLKNHFHKEFFKEPIKVSQRTFKVWFFKAPFLVPQRNFQTRVL